MAYWTEEKPVVADTGKNVLRWYVAADKLQVSMPDWADDKGEMRQGKTVTLDLCALAEDEVASEMLQRIVEGL